MKRDEPLAGSGVQQTRDRRMEQAVKAVRNREGGTGPGAWQRLADGSRQRLPGVDIRTARRRGGTSGRIPREEGHRPSAERELCRGAKSKKAIASNISLDAWKTTREDLEGQPGDG
jgi:hypothetical protein